MEKQANDAFNTKQTRRDLARDHKLNYDQGGAVTEDQIAARAAEQPFKNLGAKPDFTPQNPAEVAQFAAYHGETGIVPAMVKQSIAAMGKSPNPLDMKGYIDTYNVVEADVARQLDRQMGPANPNDVGARNELIKAKVQAQLGDEAGYLLTVKQHGAEAAYKLDQANLSTSKSGQSGGPSAELQTSLDTALDTVAGNLKGVAAGSTVLSHLLTGQVFSDQTALQSHREAAADRLLTQTPGAPGTSSSIGQFFRNAVPGLGGDDRFTGGITFSPEARAMLKQWGTVYSAVNGKAVKDQAGGKNAEEFIVNLGLERASPRCSRPRCRPTARTR